MIKIEIEMDKAWADKEMRPIVDQYVATMLFQAQIAAFGGF